MTKNVSVEDCIKILRKVLESLEQSANPEHTYNQLLKTKGEGLRQSDKDAWEATFGPNGKLPNGELPSVSSNDGKAPSLNPMADYLANMGQASNKGDLLEHLRAIVYEKDFSASPYQESSKAVVLSRRPNGKYLIQKSSGEKHQVKLKSNLVGSKVILLNGSWQEST